MASIRKIESLPELDEVMAASQSLPVYIFKHSTTCGTSAAAWDEFRSFAAARPDDQGIYALIDVHRARPVSNEIASRVGIRHESPQAILLRGAAVAWHASHWDIDRAALENA